MNKRISVISLWDDVPWESCRHITKGLIDAYSDLEPEDQISFHKIPLSIRPEALVLFMDSIVASNPHVIVFLDTFEVYGHLLRLIFHYYGSAGRRPILRFHPYGDFTLRAYLWTKWAPFLKNFQVELLCASEQQKRLVENLLIPPHVVGVCPFPVRAEEFKFDVKLRDATRSKLGFKKNEFVILYTGRMSLQKNVLAALKAFTQMKPQTLKFSSIIFAGHFDDLCGPIKLGPLPQNGFYDLWQTELEKVAPSLRKKIRVYQGLPRPELRALYCAADVYLSFSLVHDEDFGMAPAEAAVSGLPLILTRWGGFAGFRNLGLKGEWVKVKLGPGGAAFDLLEARATLEKFALRKSSLNARLLKARIAEKKLSVSAVTGVLKERNLKSSEVKRFIGFDKKMNALTDIYVPKWGHIVYPSFHRGSTYEQIYRHYIEF